MLNKIKSKIREMYKSGFCIRRVIRCAPGYNKLWAWFGLSHASWLTIPRVLLHEMPDEWQRKLADLLNEYDEEWCFSELNLGTAVVIKNDKGKYVATPDWIINYRHPQQNKINKVRARNCV